MKYFIYHYVRRIVSKSPGVLIKKIMVKAGDKIERYLNRKHDHRLSSFLPDSFKPPFLLNRPLTDVPQEIFDGDWSWLDSVTRHYLSHRFDLLGSGWVRVFHGAHCNGLEGHRFDMGMPVEADREGCWLEGRINPANLVRAKQIWGLIDVDYCPIDWQLDFKSGYRWREDVWYRDIKFGHLLGADVKVPWELARMQHLPHLVWAYALSRRGSAGFDSPERYMREFRNQVLDFISTNPPRWGVNWACTMDVAIRVSNWLVAYNLFVALGAQFDDKFEEVFIRSVYEHGKHIIANLEVLHGVKGNHYLSDVVGLLFVAACLPCSPETDAWLAFSIQELLEEVKLQFHKDGSNFEASTSYHRLSAELVVYATALALGLSDEKKLALLSYDRFIIKRPVALARAPLPLYSLPNSDNKTYFPEWYFLQLERMAEFSMDITKPNGHAPQIGDNDNGRFLKLIPSYTGMTVREAREYFLNLAGYNDLPEDDIYWVEDVLDHRHLVAAINGLFARVDFDAFVGGTTSRESRIVTLLNQRRKIVLEHVSSEGTAAHNVSVGNVSDWHRYEALLNDSILSPVVTRFDVNGAGLLNKLEAIAYPDFGLYLFRSERLYLAIRCGSIGQNGNGGHAHNDQLSIELEMDGRSVVVDPGTYNYTALPKQRNAYRSVRAHFAPRVADKEPGVLSIGEFVIGGNPQGTVLYFGPQGFLGMHNGYEVPVFRKISFEDNAVVVADFSPRHQLSLSYDIDVPFSPAYGVKLIQNRG
jgi:hypothetical protein